MAQAWGRLLLSRTRGHLCRSQRNTIAIATGTQIDPKLMPSRMTASRFFTEGAKLFVGGISFNTTEDRLRDAFAAHGDVMDAKIIMDRETGRSRGFGFITYYKEEDADTALSKLNGHTLDGRVIRVDRASSRPARPMGGGFGGGDGGYGGGSGGGGFSGGFNDSEPAAAEEDWGSLPSLNVDAASSQN